MEAVHYEMLLALSSHPTVSVIERTNTSPWKVRSCDNASLISRSKSVKRRGQKTRKISSLQSIPIIEIQKRSVTVRVNAVKRNRSKVKGQRSGLSGQAHHVREAGSIGQFHFGSHTVNVKA